MNKIDQEKTKNLAAGGKFRLDDIPVKKFFEQAQYIENSLLPKIAGKSGKASVDYQFFTEVYKSLVYAAMLADRDRIMNLKLSQATQLLNYYRETVTLYERELTKYTTIEDVMFSGGLDHIISGVAQRAHNILKNKG